LSRTENIESAFKIKYEMKYLFLGFIVAIAVAIVFIHIILFITGDDRFIGTTSAVLLGSASFLLLFTILSNPGKKEVQKFKWLFVALTLWCLGEFTYSFYQIVLNIDAPYPGVGEIFYLAGEAPLILFTYRSFKNIKREGKIKRKVILFVVTPVFVLPVTLSILFFSQDVDFQSQWSEIVLDIIFNYSDAFLLSLSILILTKLPRNNPYIYHWILFAAFMILTIITDFFYLYIAYVSDEFLSKTELIWEGMWAFSYLCILASIFWYYKLIHILSDNWENSMTEDYEAKYWNNISAKDKNDLLEEDRLHTENIQDFNLVEDRIDEIIKDTKDNITILFSTMDTLVRKETQSILEALKKKTTSNILVRILFPLGVDDSIISSYSEVANVRIFESKLKSNKIVIVPDYTKILLVSTTGHIYYDEETAYTVSYSGNDEIAYAYATTFEKLWLIQTVTKLEVR
jgi:hypothetical protein